MKDNWKDDLFTEGNLSQAYRVSKTLARSSFNWWTLRLIVVLLSVIGAVWIGERNVANSFAAAVALADTAFDLTVQILGFLIGGFAIFATISDSKLMVRLAKTKMQDSELSVFKTIFYNFISVFYIYVVTLSVGLVIKTASTLNIVGVECLNASVRPYVLSAINAVTFVVMGYFVVLAVLRLKSFIWNIYQAFLTFLVVGEMARESEHE